jgi:O-antigen/teichoic acid export membrane protein
VLITLGVALPGLLVQDAWRYSFFSMGRGGQAFLNDLIWVIAQFAAFTVIILSGVAEIGTIVLAWGGAASIAAVVGMLQARVLPRPLLTMRWLRRHRDLGTRYVAENVSISAENQIRAFGVGGIAGVQSVGLIRAAELLLGPLNIVHFGVELVALPEAIRAKRRSARRLRGICLLIGTALAAATVLWTIVLLVVPDNLGTAVLGSSWDAATGLLIPMALFTACSAVTSGASVGLRALAAARRSLRSRLISSSLRLAGGLVGAGVAGALGSAWGVALGAIISTALWWWQFSRALRESEATPCTAISRPS